MRHWSIALFRVFGIRLELHATFVLLLAYAVWAGWAEDGGIEGIVTSVVLVLLMFLCVVLHELGHCFAARHFGIGVNRILLLPIGGMAEFSRIPRQPVRELVIALAGPAVNYVLVAVLVLGFGWPDFDTETGTLSRWSAVPGTLIAVNLIMGVFNLLPAFPMDGGRVLRALLAMRFDYLPATRWAARIGQAIALLLASAAVYFTLAYEGNHLLLAALFLFIAYGAETEYRFVRRRELFAGLIVANVTRGDFLAFPPEATIANALEALRRAPPSDLLLVTAVGPTGLVPRKRLAEAIRAGRANDALAAIADHDFNTLQAEWPLGAVIADLARSRQRTFPVYSHGRLIGVCDLGQAEASAALLHAHPARR